MKDAPQTSSNRRGLHRSQSERSSDTRRRACEATLEGLAEVGHERISTSLIAQRAKISRGAMTHQFPTRQELFVAALRYLHDAWEHSPPVNLSPGPEPMTMAELTEMLWQNLFCDYRYLASIELMLAARQDNDLGRMLRAEMGRWILIRDARLLRLLGHDADNLAARKQLHLTLSTLRGIAVHASFDQSSDHAEMLVSLWKSMLETGRP